MKQQFITPTEYRKLCKEFGEKPVPCKKQEDLKQTLSDHISLVDDFLFNLIDLFDELPSEEEIINNERSKKLKKLLK